MQQTFFKWSAILHGKQPLFRFWALFGGLGTAFDSLAHRKARSGLHLSVLNCFAKCYGWGATREYRLKIGVFVPTGPVWPRISSRKGRPHQPFFLSENYDEWSFMSYKNLGKFISFCHNPCVWQTERQTERRTERFCYTVRCTACSRTWLLQGNITVSQ